MMTQAEEQFAAKCKVLSVPALRSIYEWQYKCAHGALFRASSAKRAGAPDMCSLWLGSFQRERSFARIARRELLNRREAFERELAEDVNSGS